MPDVVRIPITNIYAGGPYTARIFVGAHNKPMNVFLDTGSSTLVLSRHAYCPDTSKGDVLTSFAQTVDYADKSSWTGAVIHANVSIGEVMRVAIPDANVAIAYEEKKGVFDGYDGILGLAYAALDDAALMRKETWPRRYTQREVERNLHKRIKPYLNQLAKAGITFDKISFYTRRYAVNSELPEARAGTPHHQGSADAGRDGRHPVQRVRRKRDQGAPRFGRRVDLV